MSRHRFFVESEMPEADGPARVPLSTKDAHHALHVLRLETGEHIVVVEPGGRSRVVRLEAVSESGLFGCVLEDLVSRQEPHLTLVQGIIKGPDMDEIVRHAVELGAERIIPLLTERTVVRLEGEKAESRKRRWERIAEGAARQSQRARIPVVDAPLDVDALLPMLAGFDASIVLWEESAGDHLSVVLERAGIHPTHSHASIALVIGPEGGLTPGEVSVMSASGARVASLGPAVLRAQTASLAALTLAANALGAL